MKLHLPMKRQQESILNKIIEEKSYLLGQVWNANETKLHLHFETRNGFEAAKLCDCILFGNVVGYLIKQGLFCRAINPCDLKARTKIPFLCSGNQTKRLGDDFWIGSTSISFWSGNPKRKDLTWKCCWSYTMFFAHLRLSSLHITMLKLSLWSHPTPCKPALPFSSLLTKLRFAISRPYAWGYIPINVLDADSSRNMMVMDVLQHWQFHHVYYTGNGCNGNQ